MNGIFWVILIALILDFAIGLFSTILNVRSLKSTPPFELEDVYKSEEYRKSQEYTRVQSLFGLTISTFKLVLLLTFWLLGGFNYIDQTIRLMGWNEVWNGVAFIGILAAFVVMLDIPLSLYSTFVIEQRFGFNKTTYSTFVLDTLKSVFLLIIIGAPLLIGILYFFEYTGSLSWLYVWVFVTVISFIISIIGPIWIMPIFNKFTPLESGELRNAIVEYASEVKFTYGNIYVIDGSKRSAHSNAFFTGFGKTKRIALFDTLIEQLSTDEIVSVIAHEVGHNKKRHIVSGMALGVLHTGVLLFLFSLVMENQSLFEAFSMKSTSIYASIVFFGLLFTPIELIISPVMHFISRRNEYQADQWAVETTTSKNNLISGLKKLAAENLANLSPHPAFVMLNYSHPPLFSRVESISSLLGCQKESEA
ncbi:MAG: M48 family metallopeptidase [SAR202 cluster bacterium]|jgi:STE24 endopeptidase|nr:M48 family metallopeptidase [SAR202 cluster bacterium]